MAEIKNSALLSQQHINSILDLKNSLPNVLISMQVFNAAGNPITVIDAAGRTVHYEYDSIGRICAEKDEYGQVMQSYEYSM